MVEKHEKDSVVVVSMKQIWYDVREILELNLVKPL